MVFGELLVKHISENMLADQIDQALVDRYLDNAGEISYAPTSDRSIISQINEMVMDAKDIMEMNRAKTGDLGISKHSFYLNCLLNTCRVVIIVINGVIF
ncbi:DUF6933 domain-containing protein [Paenibacillus oenotherae]|uniref:DUF6933 domain-containing protein n=1 Tax=Paenibacillus oenotherae TaxID=1435645 RepID=UPI003CCECD8D